MPQDTGILISLNDFYFDRNKFNANLNSYYDNFKRIYLDFKQYTDLKLASNQCSRTHHENNFELEYSHQKNGSILICINIGLICLLLALALAGGSTLYKDIQINCYIKLKIIIYKSTSSPELWSKHLNFEIYLSLAINLTLFFCKSVGKKKQSCQSSAQDANL